MNKHVFGFALFSFIVGVAIAVSGWLAFKTVSVNVFEVNKTSRFEDRNYCPNQKFKNSGADVKIEQAVLDVNTKQLKTFLWLNPSVRTGNAYDAVRLHFFVKNEKETRYLETEDIWVKSAFDSKKESVLSSLKWLDKLESFDNLYVVPQTIDDSYVNYKTNPPRFDSLNAAPVLLSKGRNF
jgi:hypothetical protein